MATSNIQIIFAEPFVVIVDELASSVNSIRVGVLMSRVFHELKLR